MQKVIFDSSFLMAVAESPTNWSEDILGLVGGYEAILLECVKRELERIASGRQERSRSAKLSLEIAAKFTVLQSGSADVDSEVISAALSLPAAVATSDRGLAEALARRHAKVISLRGGRVWTP